MNSPALSGTDPSASTGEKRQPPAFTTVFLETASALGSDLREAALDHAAFEVPLPACRLAECRATCCHDGVRLPAADVPVLRAVLRGHGSALRAYCPDLPEDPLQPLPGGTWKSATHTVEDADLPAGYPAHFTRTRCVFLDSAHRCALQRLAADAGHHPWHFKPLTCWMHPLLLCSSGENSARPVLTLPSPADDPQRAPGYPGFGSRTHCGAALAGAPPAAETLAAEFAALRALSGRDFPAELAAPPAWKTPARFTDEQSVAGSDIPGAAAFS